MAKEKSPAIMPDPVFANMVKHVFIFTALWVSALWGAIHEWQNVTRFIEAAFRSAGL